MSDMSLTPPLPEWLSARLCPFAHGRLTDLSKRVARRDQSLTGVTSLVLRHSLLFAVLRPPLAAALRDFKCPRGESLPVRAAPRRDREGPAFSYALHILPSCFPEGSVHRFVEHGLVTSSDDILRLLTEGFVEECTALYAEVLSRTAYDLRPSLAARFDRG